MKSWTGVFQYGTFSVLLRGITGVCLPQSFSSSPYNSFSMLIMPSAFLFQYSIPKFVLIPFPLVVGLSSCIFHLFVDRIFFCYFEMPCIVWIVWLCLDIFWDSLLSPVSFDLSLLVCQTCLLFCVGLFISTYPCVVFLL